MNDVHEEEINAIPPSPDEVFEKAVEMPLKVNLRSYRHSLFKLREKGYTFREIAEWATETLGIKINRSQVVYILTAHPGELDDDAEREHEEYEWDAHDEHSMASITSQVPGGVPPDLYNPPTLPQKAKGRKKKAKS